jgi:KilA-N domain
MDLITRNVNGITVGQKAKDGFINATAMASANGKILKHWFENATTLELFSALSDDLGINSNSGIPLIQSQQGFSVTKYAKTFPSLITMKRGSPENGGGTWIHPDLAIQLAQWCSPRFALQVSRWIQEWMLAKQNPIRLDQDRVNYRDILKDDLRLQLASGIKRWLKSRGLYNPSSQETHNYFAQVHDAINVAITGETSREMKSRLKVDASELIRDYFPIVTYGLYVSLHQAAINNMEDGMEPIAAVDLAVKQSLPRGYQPKAIEFTEGIGEARQRLKDANSRKVLAFV